MNRLPVLATVIVAVAVAAMIGLGIWQLKRAEEKAALIALYQRNQAMSSQIALPMQAPVPDAALYRHASAMCLRVTEWRAVAGRAISGAPRWRYLATCSRGMEGPGFIADMGVVKAPGIKPRWTGGAVSGKISLEPLGTSLLGKLLGKDEVPRPMLVSAAPAPGLALSAPPSLEEVPNNHLAYAVQWFVFAGLAALIYFIALRRRAR